MSRRGNRRSGDWWPFVSVALLVVVAIAIFVVVKFFEFVGSQN